MVKELVFPGLREGESLSRQTKLPPRATLLARDGSVLADGEASGAGARSSPLGVAADAVIGEVGPIPASRLSELEAEGVPTDAVVGTSGLERALDESLRGTPGGELLAGERVLATAPAKPSPAIRTTISASLQRTAATALGGQFGGIVAMNPSNGEILAVAGIGIDDLQPPGSTFKMVTLTAALEAKVASERSVFPYATSTTLDGVKLENANGESCGGSLALAFAVSCNSVFAPLGVKIGASRLVATAEQFGFNHAPGVEGARREHASPGRGDTGRTRPRLDRDRPRSSAGLGASDGDDRSDYRRRGQAPDAELPSRPYEPPACHQRRDRTHREAADDRRGARRDGNLCGHPRRGGGGKDRHRGTGTPEMLEQG